MAMIRFLLRRLGLALGTLLVLSAMVYFMVDLAMDPLADLRQSTAPNKADLIAHRVALLKLNEPAWVRYWDWLSGFVHGDLGVAWHTQQPVTEMLKGAVATSIYLVLNATILALVLGIAVGIISALRQYTAFDYSITFVSFVLYSLPVFWVAVLLKQFMAIGLNDFLDNPSLNWTATVVVAAVVGAFWAGALGGELRRKLIVFGVATVVTIGTWVFIVSSGWLDAPQIGLVGIVIIGLASAVAITMAFAGLNNKLALYSALTTAVVGVGAYYGLQWFWYYNQMNLLLTFVLLAVAIVVALLIGWLWGGPDRGVSMRGAVLVALVMSVVTFVDRVMQAYPTYYRSSVIHGRPIATIGSETPNLGGDFWATQLDQFTHLLLPTVALVLISFASYTRYQRGSMLEVLSQDYIRTARAKGLTERVVIIRHALRNALMPLASVIPVDLVSVIGGAVITETIFGWSGMGKLFVDSLGANEADPVMAYVMITGALAIVANLLADLLYAVLDPRIRVSA
jgi:peptide/nickel transport system permease protein